MPRNRYTRVVRKHLQARKIRQEKEIVTIADKLRCHEVGPLEVPPINKVKERRSVRLEQKCGDKANRRVGSAAVAWARSNGTEADSERGERSVLDLAGHRRIDGSQKASRAERSTI
jgi:hypothetical protein